MARTLDGQVALLTGGGSGIGLAIARRLVHDGAHVVLTGRSEERLAAAADAVRAAGGSATPIVADTTDEDALRAAVGRAEGLGRLTMAVASAGTGAAKPFFTTTREEWDALLATNLTGTFLLCKHAGAAIVAAGGGSIVAISSIAGTSTHRHMAPYCVSKAGVEMLVRTIADELGGAGLRANAIRPGLVPTDLSAGLTGTPVLLADYLAQMPLGRVGSAAEVAELARFLLGPESAWITGTCISADGGHHLRRGPDLGPVLRPVLGDAAVEGRIRPV